MKNNYKNNFQITGLIFTMLFTAVILFTNGISHAQTYAGCYEKDKDKQKQCIENMFDDICGKKKGDEKKSCLKTQSKNVTIVWSDLVDKCSEKDGNSKQECKNKYTDPSDVQGFVNDNGSDNEDPGTDPLAQTLSDKPPVNGAPSEKDVYEYSCKSGDSTCLERNPIVIWLNVLINITAGIIGVGAVLMLIVAGIQYITSRDNAQGVADAKKKIINVVIGLAAFVFLYAFLNWLIPGGVFA